MGNNGNKIGRTTAVAETDTHAVMSFMGRRVTADIIPLSEACEHCKYPEQRANFKTNEECVKFQAEQCRSRGFTKVLCMGQLINVI